jgi:hypothetical protein
MKGGQSLDQHFHAAVAVAQVGVLQLAGLSRVAATG